MPFSRLRTRQAVRDISPPCVKTLLSMLPYGDGVAAVFRCLDTRPDLKALIAIKRLLFAGLPIPQGANDPSVSSALAPHILMFSDREFESLATLLQKDGLEQALAAIVTHPGVLHALLHNAAQALTPVAIRDILTEPDSGAQNNRFAQRRGL